MNILNLKQSKMILNERDERKVHILNVARAMMAAARTAPKGHGRDNLEIVTVSGGNIKLLAEEMRAYSEKSGFKFFLRDADNVEESGAVVLIGTKYGVMGLDCGFCGFPTCKEKEEHKGVPCAFNTNDLGIALGSAVSIAADYRIDNRIMYSAGRSAIDMGLMGECEAAFAVVLSTTGKNPFFDRRPKE